MARLSEIAHRSPNELDVDERRTRLYAAYRSGDVSTLIEGLRDPDLRAFAARRLAEIGDPSAISALIPLLAAAEPASRIEAVRALAALGANEQLPRIVQIAEADPNELVRRWALASLGNFHDTSVLPLLSEALQAEAREVRQAAAVGLGHLGAHEALPQLRLAMRREFFWHRGPFRRAIAEIGTKQR